jgi:hypothetical protein
MDRFKKYDQRYIINNNTVWFLWLGSALTLLRTKLVGISEILAFCSFLITLLGFIGYILGVREDL